MQNIYLDEFDKLESFIVSKTNFFQNDVSIKIEQKIEEIFIEIQKRKDKAIIEISTYIICPIKILIKIIKH